MGLIGVLNHDQLCLVVESVAQLADGGLWIGQQTLFELWINPRSSYRLRSIRGRARPQEMNRGLNVVFADYSFLDKKLFHRQYTFGVIAKLGVRLCSGMRRVASVGVIVTVIAAHSHRSF
jgi:hypothetical protein